MSWQEWLGSALWVVRQIRRPAPKSTLVIPCTSAGSLGDQAMLDVLVGQLVARGHKVRFLEYNRPFFRLRHHVELVDLSSLGSRWRKAMAVIRELLAVEHCAYLGADVLNDRYGGTQEHLDILRVAQAAGVRVHVQGFSLEHDSGPVTSRQLRALSSADMMIRDPVSFAHSEAFGFKNRRLVADMAFLLTPGVDRSSAKALMEQVRRWKADGRFILGLNVSGPTLTMMPGGVGLIAKAFGDWLSQSEWHRAVLLSHDVRSGAAGDSEALAAILDQLPENLRQRALLLDDSAMAWELKQLCGSLDLVVTGRMHLAIASMGMTTPVLCLAYMGKFRGLMEHIGIDTMVVDPQSIGSSDDLLAVIGRLQRDSVTLREKLAAKLPEIRDMSQGNFHWVR